MDPTPFHSKALDRKAETFVEAWARGFYTIARERLTIAGGGGPIWDRQAARPLQRPALQHLLCHPHAIIGQLKLRQRDIACAFVRFQ